MLRIQTKLVPIESSKSMSLVERYYVPFLHDYSIIKNEAQDTDVEEALQMAVKYVKDSAGPESLAPTLLVYGALHRIGLYSDPPILSSSKVAVAVQNYNVRYRSTSPVVN